MTEAADAATLPAPTSDPQTLCTIDLDASSGLSTIWRREVVDAKGRPRSKAVGQPASFFDYGYDDLGRVKRAPIEEIAAMMYFDYDGTQLMVSSDVGGTGYYRLDAKGRAIAALQFSGGAELYKFSYDAGDRLLTEIDPTGDSRSYKWEYDDRGFVTSMAMARKGESCQRTWSWTHGPIERVVVRNEAGVTVESCQYDFDDLDRLVSAHCDDVIATWLHPKPDVFVTSISQAGFLSRVEKATGTCQKPTRQNLSALIEPTLTLRGDPRPSPHQLRRLGSYDIPRPVRRCD